MAFLKFSRDKRGVEHFSLVQPTTNRRGKIRPRVLYWFRSPPDVKVGREPFDAEVRRALETQNPDIAFDWRAIVETPIPSADADKWRERRRAERAAKHAAAEDESAEAANGEADAINVPSAPAAATPAQTMVAAPDAAQPSEAPDTAKAGEAIRKRRRRRRGGGSSSGGSRGGSPSAGAPAVSAPAGNGSSGD